jgi:hypothetical protein
VPRRSKIDADRILVILGRSGQKLPIMLDWTLDLFSAETSNS